MKKRRSLIYAITCFLLLVFFPALPVSADGSGNIDGGGGMGNSSETDVWHGADGVRVTIVSVDGTVVSTPIDLSNFSISNNPIHFGKICKTQYRTGTSLSQDSGTYSYSKPGTALPRIVTASNSTANVAAIKRYFCSEYASKLIASKIGMDYKTLISGQYKLLIEPMAYFTHGGRNYAMTATEAALYNQMSGGTLRSKMPSLTHQNLPLAIFLESSDLGYPAWTGTTNSKVSDTEILSSLGIGIVSYKDTPSEEDTSGDITAPDVTYRVDTDVITSITITASGEINSDNPATVVFHINGQSYTVTNIVIPAGGSQVVWAKWHTPTTPKKIKITVDVSGAFAAKTSFVAKIVDLSENIPPDPQAIDQNPGFISPDLPYFSENKNASWSIWSAEWKADWKWVTNWNYYYGSHTSSCSADCTDSHIVWYDDGEWKDFGKYEYKSTAYSAFVSGSMSIKPDTLISTNYTSGIKSGYGLRQTATAKLTVDAPEDHYTMAQTAVTYFPEFKYQEYWRLLDCHRSGLTASFEFKPNEYSTKLDRIHFTPLWYPNTDYIMVTHIYDIWTPVGMLSLDLNDDIYIYGSMYDDWFSSRD